MKTRNVLLLGSGLIVVLLVAVGTLFIKYTDLKKSPDAKATATSKRIVTEVSKIYATPAGEEPTVALIQDKTKLKDQPFFATAQNGDYILVYSTSKLAMVYREKENKLINVGPINVTDNKAADVAGASTTAGVKVALLNGSGDKTKLDNATNIVKSVANVTVASSADAKNKSTDKTIVFDISGQHSDVVKAIADKVGGSVQSTLPSGETAPSGVDIVVLVGKN